LFVCGDQSGRTSAPISPQAVQTILGHRERTGVEHAGLIDATFFRHWAITHDRTFTRRIATADGYALIGRAFVLVKVPPFSLLFSLLSKIRFAGSTLPTTRDREGHRGPTWSRRSTILLRRAGDRRLGLEHGSVLARLKQPCARQSRGRSRLVADPALGHAVDRQRTHLGLGSHLQGVLLVKILIFSLLFSFVSRMKFCGSTLARTP
jgi:hypothetical protein